MVINFFRFTTISVLILSISSCTRSTIETANQRTIESLGHRNLTEVLSELIQLDIDTFHAYSQAINAISNKQFKNQLIEFRNDHRWHIKTLSKALIDLGGHPPSFSSDFKGFLTSGYTTIKASVSTHNALETMETNEIISNKYYNKALSIPMPENIKTIIMQNRKDEQRHLEAIQKMGKITPEK